MNKNSPLAPDEIFFTYRLIFETLNFAEPIERSAEPKFRSLGLSNGAIENFIRVLQVRKYPMLAKIYDGHEPPTVGFCPWENQDAFVQRVSELQEWLKENGAEPCDVEIFIRHKHSDEPE